MDDRFYVNDYQKKKIEDVIVFLVESKKSDYIQPILDLMVMSENWYGRLEERRSLASPQIDKKATNG